MGSTISHSRCHIRLQPWPVLEQGSQSGARAKRERDKSAMKARARIGRYRHGRVHDLPEGDAASDQLHFRRRPHRRRGPRAGPMGRRVGNSFRRWGLRGLRYTCRGRPSSRVRRRGVSRVPSPGHHLRVQGSIALRLSADLDAVRGPRPRQAAAGWGALGALPPTLVTPPPDAGPNRAPDRTEQPGWQTGSRDRVRWPCLPPS